MTGGHYKTLTIGVSLIRRISKYVLYTLGIFFLCVALLRPCWGKKDEIIQQEGRDVVIAIDVSRSMLAHDIKPNRLAAAKQKIKKLLSYLPAERFCLIVFAGSAIVQCPLTTDYAAYDMSRRF
jgi:Ca-activated chloride channel family protein